MSEQGTADTVSDLSTLDDIEFLEEYTENMFHRVELQRLLKKAEEHGDSVLYVNGRQFSPNVLRQFLSECREREMSTTSTESSDATEGAETMQEPSGEEDDESPSLDIKTLQRCLSEFQQHIVTRKGVDYVEGTVDGFEMDGEHLVLRATLTTGESVTERYDISWVNSDLASLLDVYGYSLDQFELLEQHQLWFRVSDYEYTPDGLIITETTLSPAHQSLTGEEYSSVETSLRRFGDELNQLIQLMGVMFLDGFEQVFDLTRSVVDVVFDYVSLRLLFNVIVMYLSFRLFLWLLP